MVLKSVSWEELANKNINIHTLEGILDEKRFNDEMSELQQRKHYK